MQDVLTTLARRLPSVPVVLYPAPVQGAGSAERIALAIRVANQRAECDVLILCRGGGSMEDLWAFNEEAVARAIFASAIPVISGVGHETDFTIADFVADERAPTPTAAAQRAVPDRQALLQGLRDTAQHLLRAQRNRLQNAMQAVDYLQRRIVHPAMQLQRQALQLDQLQQRLQRSFSHSLQQQSWRCRSVTQRMSGSASELPRLRDRQANLAAQLVRATRMQLNRCSVRLDNVAQQLTLLSPQHVLARGYSLVQDEQGSVVADAGKLAVGSKLRVTFARGWVHADVKVLGGDDAGQG